MSQIQLTNTLAAALAVANKDTEKVSGPRSLIDELAGAIARPVSRPERPRGTQALTVSPDSAAYDDGSDDDYDLPMLVQGPKTLAFDARPQIEPRREGLAALYGFGAGLAVLIPIGLVWGLRTSDMVTPPKSLETPTIVASLVSDDLIAAGAGVRKARQLSLAEIMPTALAETPPPRTPTPHAAALRDAASFVTLGDVPAARSVLGNAVADNEPAALLALAETYDPNMLAAWNARNARADVGLARSLYTRALEAGEEKAQARLSALE